MADLAPVFLQLRDLMLAAAPGLPVATDRPGDLVIHSRRADPKSGKPEWFGAVAIKKSYVAYHLFPLYADPALGATLSPALARRRHGKSCFNFTVADPALFAELATLTRYAAAAG